MHAYITLRLTGLVLLLAANGFFVASEFALVTIRTTRVQRLLEAGDAGARAVHRLRQRLDRLLSAVQLGVTLCALGLGWAIEPTVIDLARPLLPVNRMSPALASAIHGGLAVISFLLVTYLDIVLAEIVPKSLALHYTDRLAIVVARPMEAFIAFTSPFLGTLSGSARAVLRLFGSDITVATERVHSPEEIRLLVNASQQLGMLQPFQDEIIERVLDLREVPVREIMTPRHEVVSLPVSTSLSKALEFLAERPRSRIPVYEENVDHMIGLLYAKDLLRLFSPAHFRPTLPMRSLRSVLRPLPVVPESKPVDQLLLEFQHGRAHLAAVVDEFGTFAGVVTIEDVLEQIVGSVQDEYDVAEPLAAINPDESVDLDGMINIRDIEAQYGIDFPRDDSYETLAGFLLTRLRRIPRGGEQVDLDDYRFTVLAMEGHRIAQVRLQRIVAQAQSPVAE